MTPTEAGAALAARAPAISDETARAAARIIVAARNDSAAS